MNTQANRPDDYQIIVSNVGVVYSGNYATVAEEVYREYVRLSKEVIGEAAGEDVTAMYQGEPYREYVGAIKEARNAADKEEKNECTCPACLLSKAIKQARANVEARKAGGPFVSFSQAMGYLESLGDAYVTGPFEIEQVAARGYKITGESWTAYVYKKDKLWIVVSEPDSSLSYMMVQYVEDNDDN